MDTLIITHSDNTSETVILSETASVGLTITPTHKQLTITTPHGETRSIDLSVIEALSFDTAPAPEVVEEPAPVESVPVVEEPAPEVVEEPAPVESVPEEVI